MAIATKSMFDALQSQSDAVFVYGGYCDSVVKPIAESISYFNLSQVGQPSRVCHETDLLTARLTHHYKPVVNACNSPVNILSLVHAMKHTLLTSCKHGTVLLLIVHSNGK